MFWEPISIVCPHNPQGLCCAFNIKAADEIFVASQYSEMLKRLQKNDKDNAYPTIPMPGELIFLNIQK